MEGLAARAREPRSHASFGRPPGEYRSAGEAESIRYHANYPNPFSDYTEIIFDLRDDGDVTVNIYTLSGRLVKELDHAGVQGYNYVPYDGTDSSDRNLTNGIYLYKIITDESNGNAEATGKMVIVR